MSRPEERNGTADAESAVLRRRYLELAGAGFLAGSVSLAGRAGGSTADLGSGTTDARRGVQATQADRELWLVTANVADRDSFFPSTSVVREGEEVAIHLRNTDQKTHDVSIEAFDVDEELDGGEETDVTFTADEAGMFPIVCELHPPWMVGQLLVLPEAGTEIPAADARELRMVTANVADRDSFFPSTNLVVEGEEVTVHLRNTDQKAHDVSIEAFDVDEELDGGEETDVTFTADEPGIYPLVCEFHPPWMVGQLLVLPSDGDFSRVEADDARELRIVTADIADRDSFFPSTNVVASGEEVTVHLRNTDQKAHDVSIEAFDVDEELDGGEETEVTFTADEPGVYSIVCEFHPPWMVGQLLVLP